MPIENKGLTSILEAVIAAANDTTNALGEDTPVEKFSAYGNLLPHILSIVGNVAHLPAEIKDLDRKEVQGFVNTFASKVDLPGEKADAIVQAAIPVFNTVAGTLIDQIEHLARFIKGVFGNGEESVPASEVAGEVKEG